MKSMDSAKASSPSQFISSNSSSILPSTYIVSRSLLHQRLFFHLDMAAPFRHPFSRRSAAKTVSGIPEIKTNILDLLADRESLAAVIDAFPDYRSRYEPVMQFIYLRVDRVEDLLQVISAGKDQNGLRHIRSFVFGAPSQAVVIHEEYGVPYDSHSYPIAEISPWYILSSDNDNIHSTLVELIAPATRPSTDPAEIFDGPAQLLKISPFLFAPPALRDMAFEAFDRMSALRYITVFGNSTTSISRGHRNICGLFFGFPRRLRWTFYEEIMVTETKRPESLLDRGSENTSVWSPPPYI